MSDGRSLIGHSWRSSAILIVLSIGAVATYSSSEGKEIAWSIGFRTCHPK